MLTVISAWMKTPLRPYIEHFDVFLQGLKQEAKISNAERKLFVDLDSTHC